MEEKDVFLTYKIEEKACGSRELRLHFVNLLHFRAHFDSRITQYFNKSQIEKNRMARQNDNDTDTCAMACPEPQYDDLKSPASPFTLKF